MKDVAPANCLTSCHMKLTVLLFGEHDQAMDSHSVTSVVKQILWSQPMHFLSAVIVGKYYHRRFADPS